MSWLSGWSHRVEITIDETQIDSDLTHFPIPVFLGTSVGQSGDDVSAVFDELTSDTDWQKVAFTKSDGTTQLYAEKEKFDASTEEALYWVSKSDLILSSSSSTTLYLYYDASHSNNTTYVGSRTNRSEVWESNYKAVFHLVESGGDATNILDSSGNNNDGSKEQQPYVVDGKTGDALHFDEVDGDYIHNGALDSLINGQSQVTVETQIKVPNLSDRHVIIARAGDAGDNNWKLNLDSTAGEIQFYAETDDGWNTTIQSSFNPNVDTWYHVTAVFDNGALRLYCQGVQEASDSGGTSNISTSAHQTRIGARDTQGASMTGELDEIRLSTVARSGSWAKVNKYAQDDNLLTFNFPSNAIFFGANF